MSGRSWCGICAGRTLTPTSSATTAPFSHCPRRAPQVLPERLLNAQYFGDVREIPDEMLEGVDAVVHLAAVSNDPMGNKFERVTEDINYRASVDLGRQASKAGVSHFVFASSCSVYGFAPGAARKETDELNPQTAYARSKVNTEKGLGRNRRQQNDHYLPAVRDGMRHVRSAAA